MYKAQIQAQVFSVEYTTGDKSIDGEPFHADMIEFRKGHFHILHNQKSYVAEIVSANIDEKTFVVKVNNSTFTVSVKDKYDELLHNMGIDVIANKKISDIKAPMPGLVLQIMVKDSQPVKKGDPIAVLEAMKMENILKAPSDGIVKKILVSKGDKVEKNQVMINLV